MTSDDSTPIFAEVAAEFLGNTPATTWRGDQLQPTREVHVTAPILTSPIRRPRVATSGYDPRAVAKAMGCPIEDYDGSGVIAGVISLGGALSDDDLTAVGVDPNRVTVVPVDGARPVSDGPNGADGENALDVQIMLRIAPGLTVRMYAAPNTDQGFLDAFALACRECHIVSCSWGGPETSWDPDTVASFSQVFVSARAAGVPVFCASGDQGSRDGTRADVVDYPASDPSVIGCGGTRLELNPDGTRASEVVWDDDDVNSATGGGVSKLFPGRQVPDVAGDADPETGYQVVIDGEDAVVGGTSAVGPLYTGMTAIALQAYGAAFDFLNVVQTNPAICYDVTIGDNGGFKAGPGRDQTTGFGVVDFGKLLGVLNSGTQVPAPGGGTTPPPTPDPTPAPIPDPTPDPQPVPVPSPPGAPGCLNVLARILRQSQQISTEAEREIERQSDGGHGGGHGGGRGR